MHILNSFFDRIYCINLDHRTDRWEICEKLFKKFNLEVIRVSPIIIGDEEHCCLRKAQLSLFRTHKNLIIDCNILTNHHIEINCRIAIDDDVEIEQFIEKVVIKVVHKIFIRLKQFIENLTINNSKVI